jgi:hypothetical protein
MAPWASQAMTALPPLQAPATGKRDGMAGWWRNLATSPRHADARHTLARYLGFTAVANLAWEIAQLPLYTLWTEASHTTMAYAVAHCTVGDVMIALSTLAVALLVCRPGRWPEGGYRRVALVSVLLGIGYTVFSEWHNTTVTASWSYAESMPVVPVIGTGASPLVQWLLLPPLAFWWAAPHRLPITPWRNRA